MFQQELKFFQQNQTELVKQYRGKVLVLKGSEVVGVFDDALDAFRDATARFGAGNFMLQPCEPGPDAYTVTISSLGLLTLKP